jgi:hypothetical protein
MTMRGTKKLTHEHDLKQQTLGDIFFKKKVESVKDG